MKSNHYFLLILILNIACTSENKKTETRNKELFTSEMKQLKDYFHIPGLAVLVQKGDCTIYEDYMGYADIENQIKVDTTTQFPIASITKVFAATALFQLQEEGKLHLDDTIDSYLDHPVFGDSIKIKHVLSHTSQGNVGKHFYYSYRFGTLTPVIEKASEKPFEVFIQSNILNPLQLNHTLFMTDSTKTGPSMAQPYNFEGETVPGILEYGTSTSSGIASTLHDMTLFSRALDGNDLLTISSKNTLFAPSKPRLPYGHGIFSQQFEGKTILWGYGQYDSYSSLLLKVPEDDLHLILLANNNLMSDPARLINGDIFSSLFALSFLKNHVFDFGDISLFEQDDIEAKSRNNELYRKKLLAEALAASFMARFHDKELKKSKRLLRKVFELFPDHDSYADLNLLHNLTFIKNLHFFKDLGPFKEFDPIIESISDKLLKKDPNNPYANVYMGSYYDQKGDLEQARLHYETIINAKNFSPFWYTAEAKNWLSWQN